MISVQKTYPEDVKTDVAGTCQRRLLAKLGKEA